MLLVVVLLVLVVVVIVELVVACGKLPHRSQVFSQPSEPQRLHSPLFL